jgi:PAS domain S-box-containing protein
MLRLERIADPRNRTTLLTACGFSICLLALVDWWTKPYFSLGFLYLLPIIVAASHLPRWVVVLLSLMCAALSETFSSLDPTGRPIRLGFEALALMSCGLYVAEAVRNRRLSAEAQERLRVLVETSPAAIVTIDERGFIELANRAAADLLSPRDNQLVGHPIAAFLPELHHALRREEGPQFRSSMQCLGHKDDGESFQATVWFSTYREGQQPKLAAIVADASDDRNGALNLDPEEHAEPEPLSARELDVMRLVVQGLANKEIATRLGVSESGVKNTLQQLFARTGVRTRGQLVRVALERFRKSL